MSLFNISTFPLIPHSSDLGRVLPFLSFHLLWLYITHLLSHYYMSQHFAWTCIFSVSSFIMFHVDNSIPLITSTSCLTFLYLLTRHHSTYPYSPSLHDSSTGIEHCVRTALILTLFIISCLFFCIVIQCCLPFIANSPLQPRLFWTH